MKQALYNIVLVFLSLALCLALSEIVIRCYNHVTTNYDYEMWRYARDLKQPLSNAKLPFHHKPDLQGNYYGVDIQTNSIGFRDREFEVPKRAGRKRILFLGDSFTLGWGVPFNQVCAKQLENRLNKDRNDFEVVNMGIGNYNSAMEVELFKLKGLKLNPDMVVLMYYINDTEPTPEISNITYQLCKHSYLLGYLDAKLTGLKMNIGSNDMLLDYYTSIYAEGSAGMKINKEAIRELIKICRDRNIKLLIVNIPDLRRLKEYPFAFATTYIRGLAQESRVPFLDLLPVFEKHEGKSLWVSQEDPHMNGNANILAAEEIYRTILGGW